MDLTLDNLCIVLEAAQLKHAQRADLRRSYAVFVEADPAADFPISAELRVELNEMASRAVVLGERLKKETEAAEIEVREIEAFVDGWVRQGRMALAAKLEHFLAISVRYWRARKDPPNADCASASHTIKALHEIARLETVTGLDFEDSHIDGDDAFYVRAARSFLLDRALDVAAFQKAGAMLLDHRRAAA